METSFEQPAASAQCPTCGNPLDSRATICAACGASLVPSTPMPMPVSPTPEIFDAPPEVAPASPQLTTMDASADAPPVTVTSTAPTAPITADQKRCGWCGAGNPLGADRCVRCNAMFPRPEQDEAMRRAAEVRIQAAEDEIALRQRMRKRFAPRWPFVARKGHV